MNKKQFFNNLSSTYADIRRLDVKKINLKGKNILEYIEESTPTITHSKDTRETVYEDDLWGQWVETKDDGTIVVHDDWVTNPNGTTAWINNVEAVQDNKAYSEITTDDEGNFTGVVEDSVVANIQTDMIKDGSYMFYYTSLESFSGDLSSLTNGTLMFCECESLISFNGDLSSLTNGTQMFNYTSLTSFDSDLSSLVNGTRMFCDSQSLTSFSGDLSSLVNGSDMFNSTSLTSFDSDLSSLVNGDGMFLNTSLASFDSDLSSLVNGSYMFSYTSLTSFSGHLSSLVDGWGMFRGTPLTSFSGDLSSLVNGTQMFDSTSLTSFSGHLSNLINGDDMFCVTPLTSFSGDLSNLVNGNQMFSSTSLKSFSGDLSSLTNGSFMFDNTYLTPQSVMYIVESIRNITKEKAKYTNGEIPWVTYDSETQKYSEPFGFMEDGSYVYTYVYTYNNPNPFTTTVLSSDVGQLTLGIDVTNDSETIEQQLQTFAEGCLCDSWDDLKQEFVDKGWTVTFQYGGTDSSITLSEDEKFRGIPVYARLIEVSDEDKDKAEYCTEDGTKFYNIDWGHDVTDYNSYQYFGSLLEACGYFGVIPKKYLEES